jgi:hypothetical protein
MIIPSKFDGYGEGGRLTSTRRVYSDGGDAPSTQTQISDLPEWAKPSAQRLLAKSEALTDISKNPYQQYKGERFAQFTPLQQQAFYGAATMDAGPEGFARQVPQYMSPYMQNVIDREKLEAARASDLLGQQQQAQATQAGAFGGYREAIQRAERERGLRSQMGDIQTKGLQAAYDRAADQFRTGINQGMAVGQQQAQLGGFQQQKVQDVLNTRYQDFLNQQRYPYQQLEFMSSMLRGTPLGTVNTMYQPPGSTLGQLAGIGMGAYGLSRMFAEGGSVDEDEDENEYAEGGVTSDQNIEDILSKLSDAQLAQAKQAALGARDMERVAMIDSEMAERASIRSGLGNAFNALPESMQSDVAEMAGGGVVALAGGGDFANVGPEFGGSSEVYTPPTKRKDDEVTRIVEALRAQGKTVGLSDIYDIQEGRGAYKEPPTSLAAAKTETPRAVAPAAAPAAAAKEPKETKTSESIIPALQVMSRQTGTPLETLMASQKKLEQYFADQRAEDMKGLRELVAAQMGEGKKLKEEALPAALAAFGFKWAQAAAKPGAKFIGSAAEASPVLSEVSADYRKAIREANKADTQLQITLRQYEIAQRTGDRTAAAQLAQQAEVLQNSRDQLALQAQQLRQQGAIAQAQLSQRGEQFGQLMRIRQQQATAQGLSAAAQLARVRQTALKDWEAGPGPRLERQLSQQYGKNWADQPRAQAEYQTRKNDYIGAQSSTAKATPVSSLLDNEDMKLLGLTE